MTWTTVDIAGKPADLLIPDGATGGVIYLHPIGQESLAGRSPYTELLVEHRLACVCPAGGHTWWADRILPEYDGTVTAEKYAAEYVWPYFRNRCGLGPKSVGLFGISMGGQAALRMGFKYPDKFPAVAGVSSAIEYHLNYGRGGSIDAMYPSREHCRQDTAAMHVHPSKQPPHIFFACDPGDSCHRGNDRLHEKLSALGVAHECDLTTRGGGHSWAYFDAMAPRALRFLADGLRKQSLNLL